jgi:hypothetical protein
MATHLRIHLGKERELYEQPPLIPESIKKCGAVDSRLLPAPLKMAGQTKCSIVFDALQSYQRPHHVTRCARHQ